MPLLVSSAIRYAHARFDGGKVMGFNFRKSLRAAPGVRLNVSKGGAGVSVGAGGLSYTTRSRRKKGGNFLSGLIGLVVIIAFLGWLFG